MDTGKVIEKYIELRDRKAEIAKRQSEELRPLSEAMEQLENWLMHQMNTLGVDQLKSNGVGTAFKSNANSVQLQDAVAFKSFVFDPAATAISNHLNALGFELSTVELEKIAEIIRDMPRWDMVDFRAGKKGIVEYTANESLPVPGVAINTISTVNIRRA